MALLPSLQRQVALEQAMCRMCSLVATMHLPHAAPMSLRPCHPWKAALSLVLGLGWPGPPSCYMPGRGWLVACAVGSLGQCPWGLRAQGQALKESPGFLPLL